MHPSVVAVAVARRDFLKRFLVGVTAPSYPLHRPPPVNTAAVRMCVEQVCVRAEYITRYYCP